MCISPHLISLGLRYPKDREIINAMGDFYALYRGLGRVKRALEEMQKGKAVPDTPTILIKHIESILQEVEEHFSDE